MLKRILLNLLVAVSFVFSLSAGVKGRSKKIYPKSSSGINMLKFVPAKADLILHVNVDKILKSTAIHELIEKSKDNPEYLEIENKLAKYGLTIDTVFKNITFFAYGNEKSPKYGIIVNTKLTESKLEKILKEELKPDANSDILSYDIETIGKRKVFVFSPPKVNNIPSAAGMAPLPAHQVLNESHALLFIRKHTVLLSTKDTLKAILRYIKQRKTALGTPGMKVQLISLKKNSAIWGVFYNNKNKQVKQKSSDKKNSSSSQESHMMRATIKEDIKNGNFAVDFKKNKDISIHLNLKCTDEKKAKSIMNKLKAGLMMIAGMFFMNEPKLGMDIVKNISFKNDGDKVFIRGIFTKEMIDRIAEYAEKNKNATPEMMRPSIRSRLKK